MAKISLNLPDQVEKDIREYAKKSNNNLTNTCIILLQQGLEDINKKENKIDIEEYQNLLKKYKKLEKELAETKEKYEDERTERIKVLENYKNFNTKLIDLMQADRVLQIQEKQPKKNLLSRIKTFFIGEKSENWRNITHKNNFNCLNLVKNNLKNTFNKLYSDKVRIIV